MGLPQQWLDAARSRRGRAALVWGVACFGIAQLGVALAIETWLPEWRDPLFGVKLRLLCERANAAAGSRVPLIVMVGSSRVEFGFLGRELEQQSISASGAQVAAFNFGMAGGGPVTEHLLVRRLLKAGIRPDLLLIEVLPPVLTRRRPPGDLKRLTADRLYFDELPILAERGPPLSELRAAWWQAFAMPCFSHRHALRTYAAHCLPGREAPGRSYDIDAWGNRPMIAPPTREGYQRNFDAAAAEYRPLLSSFEIGGPSCAALADLLQLCQRERVATMLVLLPEGADFRRLYSADAWAQLATYLDGVSRTYDVPLVNARTWSADEHFSDGHHLLEPGSICFTQRLAREHIAPWLAGTPASCD